MTAGPATYLKWLILFGLVLAVVFVSWPQLDLWVAANFAEGTEGFPLRFHPIAKFFNELINISAAALLIVSIIGVALTSFRKSSQTFLSRRQYSFVFWAVVIGPGLIANLLFKENWGRARPRHLSEFGGTAEFSPPLFVSDQCATNCSFVSGDASMAFAFLALALISRKGRSSAIAASLLFGLFIGFVRIVQGAHFLSDVLYAGIFTVGAILILYIWMRPQEATAKSPNFWAIYFPEQARRAAATTKAPEQGLIWRFFKAKPEDFAARN